MTKNAARDGSKPSGKPGRVLLLASLAFFLICVANIVIGKIAIMGGATTAPGLSDVGEFLTLFVAVVLFIFACLTRERAENQAQTKSSNNSQ